MKKQKITEEQAKNSPAGGVLVGKREGQTIIHDKGTEGGYFVGKLHKEGGIKGINKSTGQPIEVQGGEVIITAPAVADQTKREFEGQMLTNREILSKINEKGGGVSLENGGEIYFNGSSYNYGGKTMTDYEIMQSMNDCGCEEEYKKGGVITYKDKYNRKFKYAKGTSHDLEEISKDTGVSIKGLQQIYNKGIGAYKTNPESVRPNVKSKEQWAMARVYSAVMGGKASKVDSNELKMYDGGGLSTILDKVGLKNGGEIEKLIKEGQIDLKFYKTTPTHAKEYGIECKNPIYIQTLYITKENRLNGLGKKTLKYLDDYCKKNGNDVIFGHISNEVEFTKDERTSYFSDVELMKYWLHDNGYAINDDNNDFHKVVNVKYNNGGQMNLAKESKKGDHPSRDLNNYNDVLDVEADGMVGAETGLYADGGNLDFLDEAVQKFDDGGSTKELVDYIEIWSAGSSLSNLYGRKYENYKDLKKDLEEINPRYSYIYLAPNGKSMGSAIDVKKDGKNTVRTINPTTSKAKDFEKAIKRSWGEWRFEKYDLSNWLKDDGKRIPKPKPQPEPEPIKEKKDISVDLNNKKVWIDDNPELSKKIQEKAFELGFYWEIGKPTPLYTNRKSLLFLNGEIFYNKLVIDYDTFLKEDSSYEVITAEEILSSKQIRKTQPEPIKEEVRIDFEATKKYLTIRIADLTKELNFKKPRLSNEEIGFYQRDINNLIYKLRINNERELDRMDYSLRLNEAYSLKWGDINAEYKPSEDLLAPNGLPTKLTDEEWANVRSDYFSSFFGDWRLANEIRDFSGVSKVIDPETKEPMPVYHGTNVLFTEWKTYKTNNAHYFAKNRDFSQWFAEQWSKGRGDISAKDSNLLKALNPNKGEYLYRCFLDIKNPIDFSRFGVEKRPVSDFLMFLQINYNIGDFDFWTNFRLFNNLAQDTLVYSWMIIRNWQSFTEYIKMATTYDGYIFYEYHPEKVGTGLDGASLSFCAFDSSQIKFTTATEFNALITDSRFEQGGKL